MDKEFNIAFVITCPDCGFRIGIQRSHVEEMTSGVWGEIRCLECSRPLNDLIKIAAKKNEA